MVKGNQSEVKKLKAKDGLITSDNCFPKQMEEAAGSVVSWMMRSVRYLIGIVMS